MIKLYTKNETLARRLEEIGLEFLYLNEETPDLAALFICDPVNLSSLYATYPNVKVLALSTTPSFSEGMALLQKGIRGYGNAFMQKVHLLQAISTIENDAVWLHPEMMQELILHGSKAVVSNEDVLEALSTRERDVAKEIEKGLSNKEIASALNITERTVKAHLSSVYEKLGVNDRLALALLLRK
ncbi:MAG: response regulator transcription factor [Sulfurimonadaceae bacterium]